MATTGHGIVYPTTADNVALATHYSNLAASVETALDTYETFSSWTPTWSSGGFTSIGAGGVSEGFYMQIGKFVHAEFRIQLGTGPTVAAGSSFNLTLPVVGYTWGGSGGSNSFGSWMVRDQSATAHFAGTIGQFSGNGTTVAFNGCWGGAVPNNRVSDVLPMTWAIDDILSAVLNYRAA